MVSQQSREILMKYQIQLTVVNLTDIDFGSIQSLQFRLCWKVVRTPNELNDQCCYECLWINTVEDIDLECIVCRPFNSRA